MKVAVRYFTRSGNTRKLAEAIADAVGTKAQAVSVPQRFLCGNAS